MPDITVSIGPATWRHTVSAAHATRMINALCASRGITPAAALPLCQQVAKQLFTSLKAEAIAQELKSTSIPDIPATES